MEKLIVKKLIDLPLDTAAGLMVLAAKEGLVTKPYMEKVLIEHENKLNPLKRKKSKKINHGR